MFGVEYEDVRSRFYLLISLAYLVIGVIIPFTVLSIDYMSFVSAVSVFLIILCLVASYLGERRVVAALDMLIVASFAVAPNVIASYLALSLRMPIVDQRLMAWDAALGFDWRAAVMVVDSLPVVAWLLGQAYVSFIWLLFLTPFALSIRGQAVRGAVMISAFVLLCFLSSFTAIWFPSLGAYVSHKVGPNDLTNINAYFGFQFLEQFYALRNQPGFVLSDRTAAGILTFPSVHAGAAALCIWGAWRDRLLRYPVLVLGSAMTVSAITHGGHYLCDVLAGLAFAAACVPVAKALLVRRGRSSATEPALRERVRIA